MKKSFGLLVLVLMLVLNFSACGGGGGGGGSASYSVGGTMSGLSGTVVLQNNGVDDLTLTADGAFTFATQVADGGAYSVTVLTQPVGQTCTASSNTGTISGADVTNVSVVCSVNSYTVGGTVSGLAGTMVLQNNSSDNLPITTNGAFTFSTAVADNSSYSVTILSDPVLQNCTVSNGSGTISGSNVTNISVTCANKSWTHPASLADNISPDGQNGFNPMLSMDNNGNAVIVWMQFVDGVNPQIFKSEYRNSAWMHPSSLNDHINPDGIALSPQVAMDNDGNAIIVWQQYNASFDYQIFKSEYRNGAWTHPASLNDNISPDGQDAYSPQAAMDNNGNAIIVWVQYDSSLKYQIYKSEYRNGAWTHPSSLADNISVDGQAAEFPQVAMDDNGNAVIVWQQSDGAFGQIFKSEYRNNAWTHPASLTDNISLDEQPAGHPMAAMDNDGNAVIVWLQSDGTKQQVFKSEYRNGAWTHPSSLAGHISPDGQDAYSPQAAMDNNGNAIIVWVQYDSSLKYQIYKSEYRNNAWTHPASLTDNISVDGQDAEFPQVAMDDNGNAVIVWQQSDGTFGQIFKSEYRNNAWTHPASLTDNISPDEQQAGRPMAAMDNDGNAVIVWWQYDNVKAQIFKSEFR